VADRISETPPESAARYDELMAIHDELMDIIGDLRRRIAQADS
jgi:hypothetical protein